MPKVAEAQIQLWSIESTVRRLELSQDGIRLNSVTGTGMAVGRSSDAPTGMAHRGGWVSRDPSLFGDETPLRLTNVRVEAVTPDSAVITFTASEDVRAVIRFGATEEYGEEVEVDSGEAIRMTGLSPGGVYHYRLTVFDRLGRRRRTRDQQLCTPALSELTRGVIRADYFSGTNFGDLVLSRPEASIDQPDRSDGDRAGDFRSGAGPDNFSVRWSGLVQIDEAANYLWRTRHDDGMRFKVDGKTVMNVWLAANSTRQTTARTVLDQSWHAIELEYFNGVGPAIMELDLDGGNLGGPLRGSHIATVSEDFYKPAFEPRDSPTLECTSPAGARSRLTPPEVFDCHDPWPLVRHDAPRILPIEQTRVVWIAENNLGKRALYAEQVDVIDTRPPVVRSPDSVSVEATSPLGTVVRMPVPLAADICDEDLDLSYHLCGACEACWNEQDEAADATHTAGTRNLDCECEPAPGRLQVGTANLTVIATDDFGNCGSARFDVTVIDTTHPIIVLGDVQFVCREAPIPKATVRDNGTLPDDIVVTCSIDGGEPQSCDGTMDLAYGDHTIRYVATDAVGLSSSATLEFNVGDDDPIPPVATLQSATTGYTNGTASVTMRVRDNCDANPRVEFDPEGETTQNGDDHTVTYDEEGVYSVRITASDEAANESVFTVPDFGIDRTSPIAKFSGLDEVEDPEDRLSWETFFPTDTIGFRVGASDRDGAAQSGIARLTVVLTHLGTGDERVLFNKAYLAERDLPPAGPRRLKNLGCEEVLDHDDVAYCDDEGDLSVANLSTGEYELAIVAVDHAGNSDTTTRYFVVVSWRIAIERTIAITGRLLEGELDDVVRLFLNLVVDLEEAALFAVDDPRLRGNGLLYTFSMISSLDFAEGQGVDTGDARLWLTRGASDAVHRRLGEVDAEGPEDGDDFDTAGAHLDTADDEVARETYAAAVLSLMNGLFLMEHSLNPYTIERWEEASAATTRMRNEMASYGRIEGVNGLEEVNALHDLLQSIIDDRLFGRAIERRNLTDTREAFLELLVRLVRVSDELRSVQLNKWIWVRNWQWPVSLQVRTMVGLALDLVAQELGENRDDPQDELLAFTEGLYDDGVEFIENRSIDDALKVYVANRCLIFELYNHADFDPRGVPPEEWGCEECVLTGDCERD